MAAFSPLLDVLADVPDPRRAEGKLYKRFCQIWRHSRVYEPLAAAGAVLGQFPRLRDVAS